MKHGTDSPTEAGRVLNQSLEDEDASKTQYSVGATFIRKIKQWQECLHKGDDSEALDAFSISVPKSQASQPEQSRFK